MNPFEQMTVTLAGRVAWPFAGRAEPQERPVSKTARMRAWLKEQGPANAATLADEAEVPSTALVGALLKTDLAVGRVFLRDGRYHWNPQFDQALHDQLEQAKALLVRHGYSVKKGEV